MSQITTVAELEALYDTPSEGALVKESPVITPEYRALIAASPFVALATAGPGGLDCSPRGDPGGVVHVADEKTLMLPDRKGNNRLDSLRNIVADPRVALLFLIPGSGTTLRINGTAAIRDDAELIERFTASGKPPRSVVVIAVESAYFQCARAVMRAELWTPERFVDPDSLPSPGRILESANAARIDGAAFDADWTARAKADLS